MKIFVVIPNWNGAEMLAECVASLTKQTLKPQIIVVDNGSVDESIEFLEHNFPDVIILRNKTNLGFTGGVNPGITYALEHEADAVALFNNDAVADKDWLKKLADTLSENPEVGIATCKLLRSDKKYLDSTGDFYSVWGIPFPRGRNQQDEKQFDNQTDIFAGSGGASLYRAEMLKEIGVFDNRFFAYYEDVDISFRAQLAGWKVSYVPSAIAYHEVSATSSKMGDFTRYHSVKNFLILYTKNMPLRLYVKYFPYFFYQFLRTTARSILDRKFHVWLKAVFKFLILLPEIIRDRYKIQKTKKVSVNYIDSALHKNRPPNIPEIKK